MSTTCRAYRCLTNNCKSQAGSGMVLPTCVSVLSSLLISYHQTILKPKLLPSDKPKLEENPPLKARRTSRFWPFKACLPIKTDDSERNQLWDEPRGDSWIATAQLCCHRGAVSQVALLALGPRFTGLSRRWNHRWSVAWLPGGWFQIWRTGSSC